MGWDDGADLRIVVEVGLGEHVAAPHTRGGSVGDFGGLVGSIEEGDRQTAVSEVALVDADIAITTRDETRSGSEIVLGDVEQLLVR